MPLTDTHQQLILRGQLRYGGLEDCARLGVVGFRRILHVAADEISQSEPFRRNLSKIGTKGLPFDLCMRARQHGLAEDLIRACPDQRFVLNQCGNPDIAAAFAL